MELINNKIGEQGAKLEVTHTPTAIEQERI